MGFGVLDYGVIADQAAHWKAQLPSIETVMSLRIVQCECSALPTELIARLTHNHITSRRFRQVSGAGRSSQSLPDVACVVALAGLVALVLPARP